MKMSESHKKARKELDKIMSKASTPEGKMTGGSAVGNKVRRIAKKDMKSAVKRASDAEVESLKKLAASAGINYSDEMLKDVKKATAEIKQLLRAKKIEEISKGAGKRAEAKFNKAKKSDYKNETY